MLAWFVGVPVVFFALWLAYELTVRPRLFRARHADEVDHWSARSVEQIRAEFLTRARGTGLTKLYPDAPLFRDEPAKSAGELQKRFEDTFALAQRSDDEKGTHGPAGDAFFFYDGGLVTLSEALKRKVQTEDRPT